MAGQWPCNLMAPLSAGPTPCFCIGLIPRRQSRCLLSSNWKYPFHPLASSTGTHRGWCPWFRHNANVPNSPLPALQWWKPTTGMSWALIMWCSLSWAACTASHVGAYPPLQMRRRYSEQLKWGPPECQSAVPPCPHRQARKDEDLGEPCRASSQGLPPPHLWPVPCQTVDPALPALNFPERPETWNFRGNH
jgi:hypothetical protein